MRIALVVFLILALVKPAWATPTATPGDTTAFTIAGTSTQVLPQHPNLDRHGMLIENLSTTSNAFIRICHPGALTCTATLSTGLQLAAAQATLGPPGALAFGPVGTGQTQFLNNVPQGEVDVIATGTVTILVIEW